MKKIIANLAEEQKLLWRYVRSGNLDKIKEYAQQGHALNIALKTGETPLHYAIQNNFLLCAKTLITLGASPNIGDKKNNTPLHLAINKRDLKLIQFLLENNADPNIANENGVTPFISAIQLSELGIADLLLKNNANINAQDNEGESAISRAIFKKNIDLVEWLIQKNADLNIRNSNLETPLLQSLWIDDETPASQIVDKLIENGADVNATDFRGQSALIRAKSNGYSSIQRLLISKGGDDHYAKKYLITKQYMNIFNRKDKIESSEFHHDYDSGTGILARNWMIEFLEQYNKKYQNNPFIIGLNYFKQNFFSGGSLIKDISKIKEKLLNNEPIIISGGWHNHLICYVITQNKILICNRGEVAYDIKEIECQSIVSISYDFNQLEKILEIIQKARKNDKIDGIRMINHELMYLIGTIDQSIKPRQSIQQTGNCYWVSTKTALLALFILLKEKDPSFIPEKIYKNFTNFIRQYVKKKHIESAIF